MVALIKGNRYLSTRCNVLRHSKMIEDLENGSIYAALSRDAKTKMGLNPSFVVYDELGSSPDRELYDAMDSAMGARKNPLMLVISTQAADDLAPMSRLIDYGLRVQSGEVEDKSFYLKFHHAPMDADPWSKAAWEAANPPLGYFRSLDDIERQAQQAQRMPDLENSFRNLILNQRVAAETKFINPGAWKACAGEAIIPPGAKVHAGLDLGSTRDLSALVIVYENPLDGTFHVQAHFWLPGDVLARRDEDRVPYDVWVKEGFLYPAGEATDPEAIALKRPSLTQSIPSRASRSTVGRSPICAGRWTSSASACRSSSMARLQGHEPGGEHAGKRGRYQEAASRRQSAADLDGAERGGDVRSGEEPQARQIQEHRPHRRRRRTGDGARDRQPAASVRSGNSGSDDRLMKMIGHSRATRVPVIAGPRLTSAGKPDDDCCPFQHGAHIDSMPIEEPLEPIRNPSAKMLLFNRAKPDQS